ncbi:MAG TPA: hypothetical protein P5572_07735 [Phycisphaerae bacterium]|nr:hypothetical protein [Phycisphaerae bacterium]
MLTAEPNLRCGEDIQEGVWARRMEDVVRGDLSAPFIRESAGAHAAATGWLGLHPVIATAVIKPCPLVGQLNVHLRIYQLDEGLSSAEVKWRAEFNQVDPQGPIQLQFVDIDGDAVEIAPDGTDRGTDGRWGSPESGGGSRRRGGKVLRRRSSSRLRAISLTCDC